MPTYKCLTFKFWLTDRLDSKMTFYGILALFVCTTSHTTKLFSPKKKKCEGVDCSVSTFLPSPDLFTLPSRYDVPVSSVIFEQHSSSHSSLALSVLFEPEPWEVHSISSQFWYCNNSWLWTCLTANGFLSSPHRLSMHWTRKTMNTRRPSPLWRRPTKRRCSRFCPRPGRRYYRFIPSMFYHLHTDVLLMLSKLNHHHVLQW